jgi:hypothetical protein
MQLPQWQWRIQPLNVFEFHDACGEAPGQVVVELVALQLEASSKTPPCGTGLQRMDSGDPGGANDGHHRSARVQDDAGSRRGANALTAQLGGLAAVEDGVGEPRVQRQNQRAW